MQHSATRETEDGLGNFVGAVCGMHHSGFVLPTPRLGVWPGSVRWRCFLGASLAARSTPTQDAKAGFLLLPPKNSVSGDL